VRAILSGERGLTVQLYAARREEGAVNGFARGKGASRISR
jgi:hypothetical protein